MDASPRTATPKEGTRAEAQRLILVRIHWCVRDPALEHTR